jgi:O-antigen/teichoic acid export membrane protein
MRHITYDAAVIRAYAAQLEARADTVVLSSSLVGGLVGAGLIVVLSAAAGEIPESPHAMLAVMLMGAAIGFVLGAVVGRQLAPELRLRAQSALCQVQIQQHLEQGLAILVQTHMLAEHAAHFAAWAAGVSADRQTRFPG